MKSTKIDLHQYQYHIIMKEDIALMSWTKLYQIILSTDFVQLLDINPQRQQSGWQLYD